MNKAEAQAIAVATLAFEEKMSRELDTLLSEWGQQFAVRNNLDGDQTVALLSRVLMNATAVSLCSMDGRDSDELLTKLHAVVCEFLNLKPSNPEDN